MICQTANLFLLLFILQSSRQSFAKYSSRPTFALYSIPPLYNWGLSWFLFMTIVVTTTKQELMESDDKESVVVTDSGKMENSGDIRKESSEIPEELSNLHQEENKDINQEKKDIDQLPDDCDDQERSGDAVNQSQGNQSSLQEASGSDQKSTQNDQEGPVNPEEKFSNHPLSNKPEQPSDQSGKDHETVDDQMEATSQQEVQNLKTQNANPDLITDQDEVKIDQDEESPSTPPHMTSASADSQATEIIGSDSSHSNGDDEHNGQQSSEDEAEESQYGRPWYQFWGSSDTPVSRACMYALLVVVELICVENYIQGQKCWPTQVTLIPLIG